MKILCKCGWEGTYFEAIHFTVGEIRSLRALLTPNSKVILDNWHGSLCPVCRSASIVFIEEAIKKFNDEINNVIKNNGWDDNALKIFPKSFLFVHTKHFKNHESENHKFV